jgi:PAS domain S-box-containing protein
VEKKSEKQKGKYRICTMAILLAGVCALTYYFHIVLGAGTVFTHLFYIPIILASFWWRRKGLVVAAFLAVLLISSHIFIRADVATSNDYLQAVIFMVVGFVIAMLSERITKEEEDELRATHQQLRASEQQLRAASQQLQATEQQLRAANQQLRADEQQLKAANQQLRADEQQLKAANQQLGATEQQLRAANQQLRADEQQLRAANQQLRASEQQLTVEKEKAEKYFDVAATMMVVIGPDEKVVHINKKGCEILGYKRSRIIGRNWFDNFLPESVREEAKGVFQQLISGKIKSAEYHRNPVLTKSGEERIIAWHNAILKDEQGKISGAISSGSDITERRKAEEALRANERKLHTLIESSHEVILSKDRDGRYQTLNLKAAIGLGGKCIKDVEGKTDYDLLPKEQADALRKIDKQVMQSGKNIEVEEVVCDAQGENRIYLSRKWPTYDDKGGITGIGCFAMDITERKKAEDKLRESEERFRNLMEHIPGISIQGYDIDGIVFYWNKASEKIYGYTADEAMGKNLGDLIMPPDLKPLFDKGLETARTIDSSGEFLPADELMLLHKNGHLVPVYLIHTAVKVEGKKPLLFCIDVDLSERRRAEEKLLNYQTQLKSLASQLSLVEEHERHRIATALHDQIAQSLVMSKIKLDALRSSTPKDIADVLDEISESLYRTIQHTRSLTFDLSFPILYELGFEAAVAVWLVEEIQEKYGIKSEFEDDEKPKPLDDDVRVLLFRNVRELLVNVVRHADAKKVKVSVRKAGSEIHVSVEDDGVGFDPAEIVSASAQAGGFGLFSIRERLEQAGGHLKIESEPGRGTTITLIAPLKQKKITKGKQK